MHEFTLKDPRKMGEHDPKYGQSYWAYTHESQMPVKFNLMDGDVHDGSKITCEEYAVRKSSKGTEYQQLKKVRVEGASAPQKQNGTTAKQFKADPDKQAEIRAEWALGKAAEIVGLDDMDKVFAKAQALHGMVDRLKAGETEVKEQSQSGYEKAQAVAQALKKDDVVEDFDESQPIDLDSIPI